MHVLVTGWVFHQEEHLPPTHVNDRIGIILNKTFLKYSKLSSETSYTFARYSGNYVSIFATSNFAHSFTVQLLIIPWYISLYILVRKNA